MPRTTLGFGSPRIEMTHWLTGVERSRVSQRACPTCARARVERVERAHRAERVDSEASVDECAFPARRTGPLTGKRAPPLCSRADPHAGSWRRKQSSVTSASFKPSSRLVAL